MEKTFMQKILQTMLLMALICLPWVTMAQSYSFSCDFENDADTAAWDFANGQTTNNWYIGDVVNHGGNRSLYISKNGTDHEYIGNLSSVYAYQTLTLSAGAYEYSYDWICDGESRYDYLRVAIVPGDINLVAGNNTGIDAVNLPARWISMDGGSKLNLSSEWTTQSGIVEIPTSGTYKLVFFWHNDGSGNHQPPAAVDNISFVLPSCPAPTNLTVSNIKADSVTVSWNNAPTSYSWNVECVPAGTEAGQGEIQTVYDTFLVISDLSAMTDYTVYVTSNCGSEYSNVARINFTTACGPVTLPYLESFETTDHYSFPDCWSDLAGSSSVYSNGSYNPVTEYGEYYLNMSSNARIATPYITNPLNTLAVDVALKMYDYEAGDLEVGVVTDLALLDNVIAVDTLVLPDGMQHMFELDFSTLNISEGGYIVFRQINQSSEYSSLYLDNVYIRELPNCRRPANLEVTKVKHNSATLHWSDVESFLNYEVVYGTNPDVESTENITLSDITDDSVAITGLTPETTYYCWVRTNCGGEYSEWRTGQSFTTQLACAKVINVEVANVSPTGIALSWDFDNAIGIPATQAEISWKLADETTYTNTMIVDNDYCILQNLQPSTNYTIRIRTICDIDTAQYYTKTVQTALNGITVGEGNSYLSRVPTACNYDYSYSQMFYPASDLTGVETITGIAFKAQSSAFTPRQWDVYMGHTARETISTSSFVPVDSLTLVAQNYTLAVESGWNTVTFTTPFVYNSDSNLVIVVDDNTNAYNSSVNFYAHDGISITKNRDNEDIDPHNLPSMSSYYDVPNIVFLAPHVEGACEAPLATVGNLTSTTADVVWGQGNSGESWQVEYRVVGETEWTVFETTVFDTIITITDLQSGTFYEFRVGTNCPEGIIYSNSIEGFTMCAAVSAPYAEDFSSAQKNPCWIYGHTASSDLPYVSMESLYMGYQAGGYVILPEMADDIASLHAMFSIKSSDDNAQMLVAIGSDPTDPSTFTVIDTFTVTVINEFQPQECNFANYEGEGHYIAFYTIGMKLRLDDVLIEPLPTCGYPSNVTLSEILSESATLTWEGDMGTSTGWIIAYKTAAATTYDTLEVEYSATTYTLTDLLPNTHYEVIISNICGSDTVAALNPVMFATECAEITLPHVENFENESNYTYPSCWHTTGFHSYGSDYDDRTAPEVTTDNAEHGKVLKFGDNANIITPRVPVEINTVKVMFDAMADDIYYTGKLAIGFTTSPTDISSAVYVDTIVFSDIRWHHYDISFTSLDNTETGYIVFRNIDNTLEWGEYFEEYYDGYIDNVTIMVDNGCPVVSAVEVSNVTTNSATISFTDASNSGNYTIGYSTVNDANNIVNMVDCTTTTTTISGLEQGTRYYVWARNNCAQGSSLWSAEASFLTDCGAINTLPYEENFDSYTTDVATSVTTPTSYPNHTMPYCWSFLNMSDSSRECPRAFLLNNNPLHYADSATCLILISSKDDPLYAILPQFTTPVNELQVSFTYRNEAISANNGTLTLGVMTDISDTSTFTAVQEYPQNDVVTPITHSFVNDNLSSTETYNIVLRYTGHNRDSYYLGLDNVVVDFADDCATPELVTLTGVTASTISLSWTGTATSYNVQYREDGATEWTDAPATNTTSTTVTGLNSTTNYDVRVQANCGTAQSSWSSIVNVTTTCGSMSIPYTEDFNSYTEDIATGNSSPTGYPNHTMPTCWTFPVLDSPNPKIFLSHSSGYPVSGNCLFFVSSSTKYCYAVLPAMNEPLDTLQISFAYRNESTRTNNAKISVGYMSDPNNVNTFVFMQEYPITNEITYANCDFSTVNVPEGSTYYIAFRYGDGSTNYYLAIDNVEVTYRSSCPAPNAPTVSDIEATAAYVSWDGIADNYQVAYKTADVDTWTLSPVVSVANYTITGLTATTEYNVRVRGICGEGDTSNWSTPVSFTTTCGAMTIPFLEDFSGAYSISDLDCWNTYAGLLSDIQNNTAELVTEPYAKWSCTSSYPLNGGSYNTYINIYGENIHHWLVSPTLDISSAANLEFDLGRRSYYSSFDADDKLVVLITSNNGNTWTTLHTWNGLDFSTIPEYTSTPLHSTIDLSQYEGQEVRIAFYGESTISGADNFFYFDNVAVNPTQTPQPTCDTPTNLAVSDITETTVQLTWNGTATTYDLEYRVQGTDVWTTRSATENSYNLFGLSSSTTYDWRVRANCGNLTSDWDTSTFTTLTPAPICDAPYELNVTDITETAAQLTWNGTATAYDVQYKAQGTTSWTTATAVTTSYSISGLQSTTAYDWRVRSNCGTLTSDWVTSTFVTLTPTPGCDAPTNLAVSDITENAAILSWNGTASAYDLEYKPQVDEAWTTVSVIENTFALTSLQSATTYDWRVRAHCGEITSSWATHTFTTLTPTPTCDVPTDLTVDVSDNSATFDWTTTEAQTTWELRLIAEGESEGTTHTANEHPYVIDNLEAATYTASVRAICSEMVYSDWSETIQFTIESEEPICNPVTNVVASNITETSAHITWTPAEGQTAWEIVYGVENFDYNSAQPIAIATAEYEITDLTADTEYDVYVRAVCGEGLVSEWSDKLTFQTNESQEGIDGIEGNYELNIYPNPTHGATTITLNGVDGKVTISIVDMNGRYLSTETLECGNDCEKRLDVTNLAQGTYFIRVLGNNINSVRKLIVR